MSSALRARDIRGSAAGHGWFGITIARKLPEIEVTGQDFEPVLEVAAENADSAGVADCYSQLPGDAMSVDFGSYYDCVLLPNFLHHFDAETCSKLLK